MQTGDWISKTLSEADACVARRPRGGAASTVCETAFLRSGPPAACGANQPIQTFLLVSYDR